MGNGRENTHFGAVGRAGFGLVTCLCKGPYDDRQAAPISQVYAALTGNEYLSPTLIRAQTSEVG